MKLWKLLVISLLFGHLSSENKCCNKRPFPNVENKTGPTIIDFLTKRVVALGAVQAGHFIVDCETYTSVPQMSVQPKIVHLLHNSEHPASVFSILETGTKQIALVADSLFDLLILKMTPAYTSKKQTKIESKGPRFELGDFVIKLGSVTMSQTFKGILVEVEYRPCVIPSNCWDLIREFMQGFMGSHVSNIIPPYFTAPSMITSNQNKQNDIYQPIDTVQQYLEHFSNYRKLNNPPPVMGMRS